MTPAFELAAITPENFENIFDVNTYGDIHFPVTSLKTHELHKLKIARKARNKRRSEILVLSKISLVLSGFALISGYSLVTRIFQKNKFFFFMISKSTLTNI